MDLEQFKSSLLTEEKVKKLHALFDELIDISEQILEDQTSFDDTLPPYHQFVITGSLLDKLSDHIEKIRETFPE